MYSDDNSIEITFVRLCRNSQFSNTRIEYDIIVHKNSKFTIILVLYISLDI